ncbi:hypothetical protein ABPG72_021658 [Tetrahymena utriculariae]
MNYHQTDLYNAEYRDNDCNKQNFEQSTEQFHYGQQFCEQFPSQQSLYHIQEDITYTPQTTAQLHNMRCDGYMKDGNCGQLIEENLYNMNYNINNDNQNLMFEPNIQDFQASYVSQLCQQQN